MSEAMSTYTIANGSNVQFLLGTQANIDKYISGSSNAQNGAFYLTNDTHRLYVGAGNRAVPVNEGVVTVASLSDLPSESGTNKPHPGEFYYVSNDNILCVYAGTGTGAGHHGHWVQINSNTDTYTVSAKTGITAVSGVTNAFKIAQVFGNNNGNSAAYSDSFTIKADDTIILTAEKETSSDSQNTVLKLSGVINKQFNISAASNVATVELEDTKGNKKSFKIGRSSNDITITADGDTVKIGVTDMRNTGVTVTNGTNNTGFAVNVSDIGGTKTGLVDPIVKVGNADPDNNAAQVEVHFSNGVATLPVYTVEQIDQMKLALNAMTYKGLAIKSGSTAYAGQGSAWTSTFIQQANTHQIGDTYLFAEPVTIGDRTLSKGTLAIARGEEDANGFLKGTITWDYVESTVDTDTKYKLSGTASSTSADGKILLMEVTGSSQTQKNSITVKDGNLINRTVTVDASGNSTVKFDHATVTTAEPAATEISQSKATNSNHAVETSITTLAGITHDAYGHVTGITTNTVKLIDSNSYIDQYKSGVKTTVSGADAISIQNSVQMKAGNGASMDVKNSEFAINSSTLKFTGTANAAAMTVDLVWGTFN